MLLRPATPDDVPAVLPMVRKIVAFHEALDPGKYAFRGEPGATYEQWLRARALDPRSVFLVARTDNEGSPAAFLVGSVEREIPIYQVREYGFIHDLWVEDQYRNEGIARQLVTLAVEAFTRIGVSQVRLHAAWSNDPARSLFERSGFRPASVEMLIDLEQT